MSQHDYLIANATYPTVRSDINNALGAIVTLNSGSTEPSTTYAYMYWADTTTNTLKQRDSGNSAWKIRGTLDVDTVISKSAAYTVDLSDFNKTILCDAISAAFTITLPAAATASDGFCVILKKTDSGANAITIDGNGTETIDGDLTPELTDQYDSKMIVCDGSNWNIIAQVVSSGTGDSIIKGDTSVVCTDTGSDGVVTVKTDNATCGVFSKNGILSLARQSGCSAYLSADQTNIVNTTDTLVNLNTVNYDTLSEFNTSTHRFTATEAGKYLVVGNITWVENTLVADKAIYTRIRKNGSAIVNAINQIAVNASASPISSTATAILDLSAGDYVELSAFHTMGVNTPDIDGAALRGLTYMDIQKIA